MTAAFFGSNRPTVAFWVVVSLFLVFLVLSLIARTPELQRRDAAMTRAIQLGRTPALDRFFRAVTILGDPLPLIVLVGATALVLLGRGRHWPAVFVAATVLAFPLNLLIKEIIRRPRPGDDAANILLAVVGRSFPSGHAMTTVVSYGFLAFLAWVLPARPVTRVALVLLISLVPFLVGLSRVYLGVHWASDIIGGWTAGLLCLLVLVLAYRVVTGA